MDSSEIQIIVVVTALVLIASMVHIVKGKTARIIETFGRPNRKALMPGLHIMMPWPIQIKAGEVNLQQQEIKATVSVKTKDNAFMELPVSVQVRASDTMEGAVKAFYELDNPNEQITSYVLNNVRQRVAQMDMAELYTARSDIQDSVEDALTEKFGRFGFLINAVLVDEPQPSVEVRDSFNRVIAAHREAEAAELEAKAERIRLIGVAEAEAESKRLQGEGMAKMREAVAHGIKESMETLRAAMPELSDAAILEFLVETNRQDTITTTGSHGNLVVMDMNKGENLKDTIAAVKAAGVVK